MQSDRPRDSAEQSNKGHTERVSYKETSRRIMDGKWSSSQVCSQVYEQRQYPLIMTVFKRNEHTYACTYAYVTYVYIDIQTDERCERPLDRQTVNQTERQTRDTKTWRQRETQRQTDGKGRKMVPQASLQPWQVYEYMNNIDFHS